MQGFEDESQPWGRKAEPVSVRRDAANRSNSERDDSSAASETFNEFVRSLIELSTRKDGSAHTPAAEALIAKLVGVLMETPRDVVKRNRVYFETAFEVLGDADPNLPLANRIFLELVAVRDRHGRGITRWISFFSGYTPLSAALSALVCTIILSLFMIWMLVSGHRNLVRDFEGTSALFSALSDGSVELLMIAVHAAFIGSIVSIIARIQDFLGIGHALTPPLIFVSVIRKPFMAAAFTVLVFAVFKAGIVSFPGVSLSGPAAPYVAWALGFLCGFSERFAQDFVTSAGQRLGGVVDEPTVNSRS